MEIALPFPLALGVFLLSQNWESGELKQKRKLKNIISYERSKNKMSSLGSDKVTTLILLPKNEVKLNALSWQTG